MTNNVVFRYISVDEIEFFYYFVESQGNPGADPVLLYLNGGPGCSGLNGFFYQIGGYSFLLLKFVIVLMSKFTPMILSILCFLFLGPLKFNITDYTGGLPTLMYEPETWTKVCNNLISVVFPRMVDLNKISPDLSSRSFLHENVDHIKLDLTSSVFQLTC